MRKAGSSLEMKLYRRPHMHQLVMHNIIPEEVRGITFTLTLNA